MGTSSARWGPAGRSWSGARRAATRYLAPAGAEGVSAAEVAARYVVALEETAAPAGQGWPAAFRLTRKVAQNLADFWQTGTEQGLAAALAEGRLESLTGQPPELVAATLSHALVGPDFSLEGEVARSSLTLVLAQALPTLLAAVNGSPPDPAPSVTKPTTLLVRQFLAVALHHRLALDLGASLEAAALSHRRWHDALVGLQDWFEATAQVEVAGDTPRGAHWRGLSGWTWISRLLEGMWGCLKEGGLEKREGGR